MGLNKLIFAIYRICSIIFCLCMNINKIKTELSTLVYPNPLATHPAFVAVMV